MEQIDCDNLQIDITTEDQKALDIPWKTILYYQLKLERNTMEHVYPDKLPSSDSRNCQNKTLRWMTS